MSTTSSYSKTNKGSSYSHENYYNVGSKCQSVCLVDRYLSLSSGVALWGDVVVESHLADG